MISAKNSRRILQVIPFGIISLLFGLIYSLLEYGILGNSPVYPSTGNPYHFTPLFSTILPMFAGLFIGAIEVLYLNSQFQSKGFFRKIIYKTTIYVLLIAIAVCLLSVVSHSVQLGKSPMDREVLDFATKFFQSFAFWSLELYMALGIAIALFYLEVSDNIGQGVLINFFTGKYHKPLAEERVFMFLDMKDSTTIAEELGHLKYFNMLREYYADLTYPIVAHGGQIYQYVGDEVVVTWRKEKGVSDNNCINCFFSMKAAIAARARQYESEYRVVPTFKAAIHFGKVTTGEIGVIKKEIAFSGDVLNTTARIQGLCNTYQAELLVSDQLTKLLDLGSQFRLKAIGEVALRGRDEKINLYSIEQN
jgi:adenylate cyclase